MTCAAQSIEHYLWLAADPSVDARRQLASSIGDLFAEDRPGLNDREQALASDILNKLIRDFDTTVRRELAERLASRPAAPHDVIVALANDESDVSHPILKHSPVLRDDELIDIIHHRSRQHQMSIAVRDRVSEAVSDALVDTGDETIVTSLLKNTSAQISDATLAYLVEEARHKDSYQEPLVLREDLSEELAKRIFAFVAKHLRAQILDRFELDPKEFDDELGDLVDDLASGANTKDLGCEAEETAPERLAKLLANSKKITPDVLVKVLRAGKIDLFESLFQQLTGLDGPTLKILLYGRPGEALAAVCRASGIPKSRFIEIYLLMRCSRTRSRVTSAREVAGIVRHFDSISHAAALKTLNQWRRDSNEAQAEKADHDVG